MSDSSKKILVVLDLDHTLIYSTDYQVEHLKILLEYPPLFIHERPFARELVNTSLQTGEVKVFTTAVSDYAQKVCNELGINYTEILSRENCRVANGMYVKYVDEKWMKNFDEVIIIDDSPEIWDSTACENCTFLVPEKFIGDPNDNGLKAIIRELTKIKSKR